MADDTIFGKIIRKEIPSSIVFEDEQVVAFKDIQPKAPVHILIVPRKAISTTNDIREDDEKLVGHMIRVAATIAKELGISADGYRLQFNCNKHGGQEVFHLHLHLLGGKPLGPMVCA
ncbi:MAG: histidine triad nucleotide-binding protein [Chitinispirillaceae bacterium]